MQGVETTIQIHCYYLDHDCRSGSAYDLSSAELECEKTIIAQREEYEKHLKIQDNLRRLEAERLEMRGVVTLLAQHFSCPM
jgi:hypothetical protein